MRTIGQPKTGREILVRIQTVTVTPLTIGPAGETVGRCVDSLLEAEAMGNRIPNKLIIDLNPPKEQDYGDMSE